jgi:general secretion pathway protein A
VDWATDPELEPGVFAAVYEHTGGVPRRINTLCDRLFLFGCIEGRHALTAEDVLLVVEELRQEVGRSEAATPCPRRGGDEGSAVGAPGGRARAAPPGDWEARLAALEAEVARLRSTVARERKLLRKAVLLQLELDAYDDLD